MNTRTLCVNTADKTEKDVSLFMDNLGIEVFSEKYRIKDIYSLVTESQTEGYRHLTRLLDEYESGINRFNEPGEALFITIFKTSIIGICGLNRDPYSKNKRVGRVRRFYISRPFRRTGVAQKLMKFVTDLARENFEILVLKTDNPIADIFYKKLGFIDKPYDESSSHYLILNEIEKL